MEKKRIALLVVVGAIVAYFVLVRPRQAAALEQPVSLPVAAAPPQSQPDLAAQLSQGAQTVAAGAAAIGALPGQVAAVGTQISTAAGQAAAIPGQVGTAITQAGTQLTTAAQGVGQAVSAAGQQALTYVQPYLPYLGPAVAVGIIVTGIAQTHRRYDVATKRCCDVNTLGMEFNCNTPTSGSIMRCMYNDASFPNVYAGQFNAAWSRERVVNLIFTELAQWYGKVQAGSIVRIEGRPDSRHPVRYYTKTGLSTRPAYATDIAPNEFMILNAQEIAQYRAIKAQIIAYNKSLIRSEPVIRDAIRDYKYSANYGYWIPQGRSGYWVKQLPNNLRYVNLGTATPAEFNINWLY